MLSKFYPGIAKYLGVDIQDEHGRHEVGYMENTKKDPINGGAGKLQPQS